MERFLFTLKNRVRNRARPEASFAKGYQDQEARGYITEHLHNLPGAPRVWKMDEDPRHYSEVLKINVMKCQWIKPSLRGLNRTMRRDEHGSWLVKCGEFQAANIEPHIMRVNATQYRDISESHGYS